MKKLWARIERLMMAVTFAEAGEHETAREIMREEDKTDRPRPTRRPDRTLRASSPGH
ncbi:MAG: hypothetical protein M0Z71_15505 [Nitrospiraceae bacterium]|nr:hypothetical protein [Nitrospiraceae bacterium]